MSGRSRASSWTTTRRTRDLYSFSVYHKTEHGNAAVTYPTTLASWSVGFGSWHCIGRTLYLSCCCSSLKGCIAFLSSLRGSMVIRKTYTSSKLRTLACRTQWLSRFRIRL
jgi:hypothetical protein